VIKVVHVIVGLNVGGAELVLKRLIESQQELSPVLHEVISLTDIGPVGIELQKLGVTVHSLNMYSIFMVPFKFVYLRNLIKKINPDIVHTWMYHSDFLGGLAAFSLGVNKIIWGVRSTDISKGGSKTTLLIRKACSFLSFYVPNVIVFAANVSMAHHLQIGYDSSKSKVIPNGFDLSGLNFSESICSDFRRSHNIPLDSLVFISVGRYSPVKDHKSFVLAALKVLSVDSSVHFIMIGRDVTTENSSIFQLINDQGFSSNFHLLGERSDVPLCLFCSDVFCLHSVTEGFPNVLGEAMLAGLPCIATDVGDAQVLLGTSEFIVGPSDPSAFARSMMFMLSLSSNDRSEIGMLNRQRIVENFSLHDISCQYLKLYLELID
jgi:glycosyltransferase involved in cell wall biosynthesis